jgi:hypothetical protein
MLVHATTAWSSTCATVPLTASNRFQLLLLLLQEQAASTDSSSSRKFFRLIFPHQDHLLKIYYSIITHTHTHTYIWRSLYWFPKIHQTINRIIDVQRKLLIIFSTELAAHAFFASEQKDKIKSHAWCRSQWPNCKSGRGNLSTLLFSDT